MMPLARVWYNVVASYHGERALDHARRRDRALRELERMERDHQRRQTQREIDKIIARHKDAVDMPEGDLKRARLRLVAALAPIAGRVGPEKPIGTGLLIVDRQRALKVAGDDCQ